MDRAEILIDRQDLGVKIADFIADTPSRIIVLHGRPASGKTELITRWVIPTLRQRGYEVLYGDCTSGFPSSFTGDHGLTPLEGRPHVRRIVVVDDFENVVDLARDKRQEALDQILQHIKAEDSQSSFVLITNTSQLTSAYALASHEPGITSAVFEIESLDIAEGLERLRAIDSETGPPPAYDPDVLQDLRQDAAELGQRGWAYTIELITLLDTKFRAWRATSGQSRLDRKQYEETGRLTGILRTHLEDRLQKASNGDGGVEITRAILDRIVQAHAANADPEFGDIPARLGVSPERVSAALNHVVAKAGLVRPVGEADYELVPPQLEAIITEDRENRAVETDRARRIVMEGLRSWRLLGSLLQRPRFEEVHLARTDLDLNNEQTRFLLLCALRNEAADASEASEYWLRRVEDRVDGMDILLSTLFEHDAAVRKRAARLLRDFPDPEVRQRLHHLAVADPDPDAAVRAQAIASLSAMPQDDELMRQLIAEAQDPRFPHRVEAIEALQIFRSQEVATVLQALVNDPNTELAHRQAAISVLSTMNTPETIDALFNIAMQDADEPDRQAAAAALATTGAQDLNRRIMAQLRAEEGRQRIVPARLLVMAALALPLAAALFSLMRGESARVAALLGATMMLAVLMLLLQVPTGFILRSVSARRRRRASPLAIAGIILFGLSAISSLLWFHGLAHLSIGRWRRALRLFAWELVGIAMMFAAPWLAAIGRPLGLFYFFVGYAVFVATYVLDVTDVLFDTFLLLDASERERRVAAIYGKALGNPGFAGLVFDALQSGDRADVRWARNILRRFGERADPEQLIAVIRTGGHRAVPYALRAMQKTKTDETVRTLERLWPGADTAFRQRIAEVFYARPTEVSLIALGKLRDRLGLIEKLRVGWAGWQFRVSIWPRAVRYGTLLMVPSVVLFLYHGVMARKNPSWSLLMSLKQAGLFYLTPVEARRNVNIVNFLAANYARESGTQLLSLFREPGYQLGGQRAVNAAIARGLVKIQTEGFTDSADINGKLLVAAKGYAEFLRTSDSSDFAEALGVLRVMTEASDPALRDTATNYLVAFAVEASTNTDSQRVKRRLQAIDTLAGTRFDRAIPALARIKLGVQGTEVAVRSRVDSQLNWVTDRTYRPVRNTIDPAGRGAELLNILSKLPRRASTDLTNDVRRELALRSMLEKRVAQKSRGATRCDLNGDGVCNARDEALAQIANDPSDEYGFRQLLDRYIDDSSDYRGALAAFTKLKRRYPHSIWPRKIIAEIHHEYLARTDTTSFERSFDEMVELRALPEYAQLIAGTTNRSRFDADFAEVALSARKYAQLDEVAPGLLADAGPHYRLNARLFLYMAAVVQRNSALADARLKDVEAIVDTLPADFYNNWLYPGTVAFIKGADLPPGLRASLLELCKEGEWYSRKDALRVLAANRTALQSLHPTP